MNVMGVGSLELLVILIVALLVLGPTRLASSARTVGRLARDLRKGTESLPNLLEELQGEVIRSAGLDQRKEDNGKMAPPSDAHPRRPRARRAAKTPPEPQRNSEPGG